MNPSPGSLGQDNPASKLYLDASDGCRTLRPFPLAPSSFHMEQFETQIWGPEGGGEKTKLTWFPRLGIGWGWRLGVGVAESEHQINAGTS